MKTLALQPSDNASRERVVLFLCTLAALALGIFAASASSAWLTTVAILLLIALVGLTLPMPTVGLLLAALIPFQFYFFAGDNSFTLRAAFILAAVTAIRSFPRLIAVHRSLFTSWLPAALFVFIALLAALTAASRYLALRGVYDWLAVFATAFVFCSILVTNQWRERLLAILIGAGTLQAALGLFQAFAGREIVLAFLRQPVTEILYIPNLLRERLADLSFNWLTFDYVSPFGTFINGIDYAVFLAAMLCMALPLLLAPRARTERITLSVSVAAMAGALVLTLKASAILALVGGIGTIGVLLLPSVTRKMLMQMIVIAVIALIALLPFAGALIDRATFLVQREQGEFGTLGRLDIWRGLVDDFLKRPLLGFGINNAENLIPPARTLSGGAVTYNTTTTESAYIALFVETGVLGFLALGTWLALILFRAFRAARVVRDPARIGILAAFVAILFGNLTITGLTTDQNGMLLGLLAGMVLAKEANDSSGKI